MPDVGPIDPRSGAFHDPHAYIARQSERLNRLERRAATKIVAYDEEISNVSVTGTGVVQVASAGAQVYENVLHRIEFWARGIAVGAAGSLTVMLRDGTSQLGDFLLIAANITERGVYCARYLTPSAGSHTYNIAAQNGAAQTSTVTAGAGGSGNAMPAFICVTRLDA